MSPWLTGLLICILATFANGIISQRPCTNVVTYVDQADTRFYADIVLRDSAGLEGIWLNITLDKEVYVLANKFGPVTTTDNINFVIKRLDFNLLPGVQEVVRVLIKHNDVVLPNIIKVVLNGRSLCPGSIAIDEKQCPFCVEKECPTNELIQSADVNSTRNNTANIYRDVAHRYTVPPVEIVDIHKVCGTVTITKDKIIGGTLAEEGNYPWQVAMIHTVGVNAIYECSAALISQKHALTAAHCVIIKSTGTVKRKEDYLLYAGSTKLNAKSENSQVFQLSSIKVHEKYNPSTLVDDIALLGLHTLAKITDYVRPLCLPTQQMSKRDIYEKKAVVAGWGYTENGLVNDLRFATMPIATPDECLDLDRPFYSQKLSPKVFCAGPRNGTNVCEGDSGASLALESTDVGNEERYYARGIVSFNKFTISHKCSTDHYAIFTDVRSYLDWIKAIIEVGI